MRFLEIHLSQITQNRLFRSQTILQHTLKHVLISMVSSIRLTHVSVQGRQPGTITSGKPCSACHLTVLLSRPQKLKQIKRFQHKKEIISEMNSFDSLDSSYSRFNCAQIAPRKTSRINSITEVL